MLLTIMGLWVLALYNLRVAALGNPLLRCVADAPEPLIRQLDALAEAGNDGQPDGEAALFLRSFFHRFALGLAMLVLELTLLGRLLWIDVLPWLAVALLMKDLVAAAIGSLATHSLTQQAGMFGALRSLPGWLHRLDRSSSLLSGLGALALLIALAST